MQRTLVVKRNFEYWVHEDDEALILKAGRYNIQKNDNVYLNFVCGDRRLVDADKFAEFFSEQCEIKEVLSRGECFEKVYNDSESSRDKVNLKSYIAGQQYRLTKQILLDNGHEL